MQEHLSVKKKEKKKLIVTPLGGELPVVQLTVR